MAEERRIWPRIECDLFAECSANGMEWSSTIVDISEKGIGIISSVPLKKGDIVSIKDPHTKARVVWAEGDRAGLEFLNE
jgi:hypothetical protein